MPEPLLYHQRELELLSLAQVRFSPDLSPAERDILRDSVRPGPAPIPRNGNATRTVRGSILRWLVTDREASALLDPNGIWVMHATIPGQIDFSDCQTALTLTFERCAMTSPVIFASSKFRNVFFDECHFHSKLDAANASFSGTFRIYRCKCGDALTFDSTRIDNDLKWSLSDFAGNISLTQAVIGGSLDLTGSKLHCEDVALALDLAQIGGEIYFEADEQNNQVRAPFVCAGDIHAPHISVGEDIHATHARFTKKGGTVLFASASLKAGVAFFDHIETAAMLSFYDANLRGLSLANAKSYCEGVAVSLDELTVHESLSLNEFEGVGSVQMGGGLIDGDFELRNAVFNDLDIQNVHATRDISASGVRFKSPKQSFYASDVQVDGQIDLSGASTEAWVCFARCKVGRNLSLRGAKLDLPPGNLAVRFESVSVGGEIDMSTGFDTKGDILIQDVSVGSYISVIYATLGDFTLRDCQVRGSITWIGVKQPKESGLYLYQTKAASLRDDRTSWPRRGNLGIVNFRYDLLVLFKTPTPEQRSKFLEPDVADQSVDDRIAWLKLQNSQDVLQTQPWQELAAFYANAGDNASSKQVLHMMARVDAYADGLIARARSAPYDWVVEDPLNITVPIVGLWLLGSLVFWRARRMNAMAPREKDAYARFMANENIPEYPPFSPLIYTLENVLPVVKLGQDQAWGPNPASVQSGPRAGMRRLIPRIEYGWLVWLRWSLILLGWALALILAGAIGSRFKA